ncbi:MAG: hypothetical protein WAW92_01700 [Minisyncoccia bacterium]
MSLIDQEVLAAVGLGLAGVAILLLVCGIIYYSHKYIGRRPNGSSG